MNSCRIIPKLQLKKLAYESGYLMEKKRLSPPSMAPEVPLTKACSNDGRQLAKAARPPDANTCQPTKGTVSHIKTQKQALSGLSNWYTNHLTAMNAIQKFKEFRQDKDFESQNYYDKLANFNYSKSLKYKRQAAGPHMDLENYLNSLRSRQKELSAFRRQSKAWERYFERSIPGWSELKQGKQVDGKDMVQLFNRSDSGAPISETFSKPVKELMAKRELKPKRNRFDAEQFVKSSIPTGDVRPYEKPANKSKSKGMKLSQDTGAYESTPQKFLMNVPQVSAILADQEQKARNFFQKLPVAKVEREGHVNNETMFNEIYGKYLPEKDDKDKKKSSDIVKKSKTRKPKSIKLIENLMRAKELRKGKKNKLKADKRCSSILQRRSTAPRRSTPPIPHPRDKDKPLLIEVTNDPKFFKQKMADKSSYSLNAPANVLLVGQQTKRPSSLKQKDNASPKDLKEHKVLVVESSPPKSNSIKQRKTSFFS